MNSLLTTDSNDTQHAILMPKIIIQSLWAKKWKLDHPLVLSKIALLSINNICTIEYDLHSSEQKI